MNLSYSTDIAIFGGGIAGLWLLKQLRQEGYQAILIETDALGGGQTLASQGIIHGGLKYALAGNLSGAANVIADMPRRWRQCLSGSDTMDLKGVKILSEHYYMWSESSFRSRLKTFLGSKSLQGRVEAVDKSEFPDFFAKATVAGSLYQLPDFVIDTESLLQKLVAGQEQHLFQAAEEQVSFQRNDEGSIDGFTIDTGQETISCQCERVIFAAGEGNASLITSSGLQGINTQSRPLHMVYLKQAGLPLVYVHCIGDDFSLTPRLTVTSHANKDGSTVWYLGGELAESGVGKSEAEQLHNAQQVIEDYFPWLDVSAAQWHSFMINRAEASIEGNHRPDNASMVEQDQAIVAYPTKLTLTPSLADKVVDHLATAAVKKSAAGSAEDCSASLSTHLKRAVIGRARWE